MESAYARGRLCTSIYIYLSPTRHGTALHRIGLRRAFWIWGFGVLGVGKDEGGGWGYGGIVDGIWITEYGVGMYGPTFQTVCFPRQTPRSTVKQSLSSRIASVF